MDFPASVALVARLMEAVGILVIWLGPVAALIVTVRARGSAKSFYRGFRQGLVGIDEHGRGGWCLGGETARARTVAPIT